MGLSLLKRPPLPASAAIAAAAFMLISIAARLIGAVVVDIGDGLRRGGELTSTLLKPSFLCHQGDHIWHFLPIGLLLNAQCDFE